MPNGGISDEKEVHQSLVGEFNIHGMLKCLADYQTAIIFEGFDLENG